MKSTGKLARTALALLAGAAFAAGSMSAQAQDNRTEITWWHAMGGARGELLVQLAESFNKAQNKYKVVAVNKGNYPEAMTAAMAAFRAGKPPHILQVFEVGTGTMMASRAAIKPVYEIMAQNGYKFDPNSYISAVTGYYSTADGKMLSFPFNSSTPVMYYNKDAFEKAGLDPNKPPKTWQDFDGVLKKLKASGSTCPYISSWQTWVNLENFSALHNVPFATKANGLGGTDAELKFNSPLHVRHITTLAGWMKDGLMVYGGRKNEPNAKFASGECAILMESSAGYATFKTAKFKWGISMLPYYSDVQGAPQNSIIGGASLWVMGKHSPAEYKGVAEFFDFLTATENQVFWHTQSGYLPITPMAYETTKNQGFYAANPGTDISVQQMLLKKPTDNSKGLRLGNFVQIRDVMDEELEAVWAGKKSPKEALDTAVERGNRLLRQFERDTKR